MAKIVNRSVAVSNKKQKIQENEKKKRKKLIKQIAYHAPKLIKKASEKINKITKYRINHYVIQDSEVHNTKRVQSKIIRDTIEHIYQTPFKVLGKFGEKLFKKTRKYITKHFR